MVLTYKVSYCFDFCFYDIHISGSLQEKKEKSNVYYLMNISLLRDTTQRNCSIFTIDLS